MEDVFKVSSSVLPKSSRVVGFRGRESLSRPYHFEIFFTVDGLENADFDMAAAIGQRATFTADRADGTPPFAWNGVLSDLELMLELPQDRGLYRLTLVPKLWLLTQTLHSRIFTDKSVRDVIEDVLKAAGFLGDEYQIKLEGSYSPEEHICQYRESDLDFISRWMEREGIYYFFEQGDDKEKLVIVDSRSAHEALRSAPVPYHPIAGDDVSAGEAFHLFTARHASLPASVKLKDYDYLKPSLDVSGSAAVAETGGFGELSTYGARFFTPDAGKHLADVWSKELLAKQVVYTAAGSPWYLRPGYTFDLEEHPRPAYNTTYLVTDVEHVGNQGATTGDLKKAVKIETDQVYHLKAHAITSDLQFRPARRTRWPRIYGVENAVVDGPADSDYAQIDKEGRYEVKFNFDESDLDKGKASTWIRMLQPHAGNPEGFHFPLRKGTEVLVVFLGGDPDRPVIAGAVPNTPNPSPVTEANHTQNVIHTGGNTRIEIEDQDGSQYIDISTPPQDTYIHLGQPHGKHSHFIVEHTDGDCLFDIGGNQDIEVGGDLTEHVVGDVEENYDSDQDTVVGGDQTLEVGGDCDEEIGGDQTLEVGGDLDEEIGGDQTLEVGGDWDSEIGGDCTLEVGGDWDVEVGGDATLEVEGDYEIEVGGEVKMDVTGDVTIECNKFETTNRGDLIWTNLGNWLGIKISASHETTFGFKSELFVGGKSDITIGASADIMVGGQVEVFVGAKLSVEVAAALEITMGPKLELEGIHLKNKAVEAEEAATRIKQMAAEIKNHGILIDCLGALVVG